MTTIINRNFLETSDGDLMTPWDAVKHPELILDIIASSQKKAKDAATELEDIVYALMFAIRYPNPAEQLDEL